MSDTSENALEAAVAVDRSLRRRCALGLTAIGLLAAATAASLELTISAGEADGSLVNLAGRQRMLSQRIGKSIAGAVYATKKTDRDAAWDRLTVAIEHFRDGHAAVRDRAQTAGLRGHHSGLCEMLFLELEPHFLDIVQTTNRLLADRTAMKSEGEPSRPSERGLADLDGQLESYLGLMDSIVFRLAEEAASKNRMGRTVSRVAFGGMSVLLVLVGWLGIGRAIADAHRSRTQVVAQLADLEDERRIVRDLNRSLDESARLNNAILESACDGVVVTRANGRIFQANPAAHRMFRMEDGELVGTNIRGLLETDLASAHERHSAESDDGLRDGAVAELSARRSSGDRFPVEVSVATTSWDGDTAWTGFLRDVTERKQMETRLGQAEKLESIGQLTAGISHEINTPMQFIATNVEYLDTTVPRVFEFADRVSELLESVDLPPGQRERAEELRKLVEQSKLDRLREEVPSALRDCSDGVGRVVEIVRAMKEYAHPGTGEAAEVNANDCVRAAATLSRNRWKDIATVQYELDAALPTIRCLPNDLNQTLLNLLVNAADAIAERGIDEDNPGLILLGTRSLDDGIEISVADNGCGMTDEVAAKAFDPFFTTKEIGVGTGQGLAICHNAIVRRQGGSISVESCPGIGTCITIFVPSEAAAETDAPTTEEAEAPA